MGQNWRSETFAGLWTCLCTCQGPCHWCLTLFSAPSPGGVVPLVHGLPGGRHTGSHSQSGAFRSLCSRAAGVGVFSLFWSSSLWCFSSERTEEPAHPAAKQEWWWWLRQCKPPEGNTAQQREKPHLIKESVAGKVKDGESTLSVSGSSQPAVLEDLHNPCSAPQHDLLRTFYHHSEAEWIKVGAKHSLDGTLPPLLCLSHGVTFIDNIHLLGWEAYFCCWWAPPQ